MVICPAQSLQDAIGAAPAGGVLVVIGRCTGDFTISKDLTIIGLGAVLDGGKAGTTVTIAGTPRVRLGNPAGGWRDRQAIRYANPRDANLLPAVVAPPLGGVLIRVLRQKRPPRNGGRFSAGRRRGLTPEGPTWTPTAPR